MTIYGAVIMDLVSSRSLKKRDEMQQYIFSCIQMLNVQFEKWLEVEAAFTVGDEWQMLVRNPAHAYALVHDFQQMLWDKGLECYAGIGIGGLSTQVYPDISMLDGPCFHAAREAINIAKQTRNRDSCIRSKRNRVCLRIGDGNYAAGQYDDAYAETAVVSEEGTNAKIFRNADVCLEELVNVLIENTEILKHKMTASQKQVYTAYQKLGTVRRVSEAYGGKQGGAIGTISEKLNMAEYQTINKNLDIIQRLLGCIMMGGCDA